MADPVRCQHMYVSKGIRVFTDKMDFIINSGHYNQSDDSQLRYYIQSAHDWTVAQHMLFWDAKNGNFTVVPFASQVVYELHSTKDCTDASCFWVEVIYNYEPYNFEGDCANPTKCTYAEFLNLLTVKGYVSTTSHYVDECAEPWSPNSHLR